MHLKKKYSENNFGAVKQYSSSSEKEYNKKTRSKMSEFFCDCISLSIVYQKRYIRSIPRGFDAIPPAQLKLDWNLA